MKPAALSRAGFPLSACATVLLLAACSPPPSGPPTSAQIQAFANQSDQLLRAMRDCDRAAQHAVTASGATSYDGSLNAEGECEKTANTLINYRFSDDIGQQFLQPLNGALSDCWAAYDAKARGLARMAQQANAETSGDNGPPPDFGQIDSRVKACVAGLDKTARAQGFKAGVSIQGD